MRRPSFQFYPGDWLGNTNLRRCTHEEKGAWLDVMCLLHDSADQYGLLRWPLADIAQAVGCSIDVLKSLIKKGVMKGSDNEQSCEPFIYTPRSGRKDGEPVTLVEAQAGPIWYSSRMVRDEYVRQHRGEGTRFASGDDADDDEMGSPNTSPTRRIGARQGAHPSQPKHPHHTTEGFDGEGGDVDDADCETAGKPTNSQESSKNAGNSSPSASPMPPFGDGSSSSSSSASAKKRHTGYSPEFDAFWSAYPNKVGKDAARKAFAKRKPDDQLLAEMLQALEVHKQSDGWTKDGGRYIPHPTTWLNQGRWQDEGIDEGAGPPGYQSLLAGGI